MPAWITITADDLNDAKVAELVTALREEALAVGQTDPMPRVIATTITEIRDCIRFCATTKVDQDPTLIPPGLKEMAAKKIVRRLKERLQLSFSDEEKTDEELYQKRLVMLTRCEWPVATPDNPESSPEVFPVGGGATVVRSSPDQATRCGLRGL